MEEAGPEEQAIYDQFVNNGMQLVHSEAFEPMMQRLAAEDDPASALADVTVNVTRRLVESARENGIDVPSDVILHGGVEILELIVDSAERAGIREYSEDEMERATYLAMDMYRNIETEAGELDQEGVAQDFAGLQQANESGELDQLLQGLQGQQAQPEVKGLGQV